MRYWPFLIAANHYSDYRVVLCPDFVQQAGRKDMFRKNLDWSLATNGATQFYEINEPELGRMSLFYNVIRVREADADVYDASGRPFVRVNGIVVRYDRPGLELEERKAQRLIEEAAPQINAAFVKFWATTGRPADFSSAGIDATEAPPRPAPRPMPAARPLNVPLAAVLALAIVGNMLLAWACYWLWTDQAALQDELLAKSARMTALEREVSELIQKLKALAAQPATPATPPAQ